MPNDVANAPPAAVNDRVAQGEGLWDEPTMAKFLGVSTAMLIAHRFRGRPLVPFVKLGRTIRYDPADGRAAVAANKIKAA